MSDINDIQAGTYELVSLIWDEPISKPGEPFNFTRHRRGDLVKLSQPEARRLVLAGAVVEPGAIQRAQADVAAAAFAAALAQLTDEQRAEVAAQLGLVPVEALDLSDTTGNSDEELGVDTALTGTGTGETIPTGGAPADDQPAPPKSASKAEWVAYAVAKGMPAADAEAATKDDLITRYSE